MKKKIIFISLIILLVFVGCKNALLRRMEVENPKIETIHSILDFVKQRNLAQYKLYFFKDLSAMKSYDKVFKLDIPEAYFFNKNGFLVPYKKTVNECNAKVDDFIYDLKHFDRKKVDSLISIAKLSELTLDKESNNSLIEISEGKLLVVLSFAKYLGKVNDEHTFHWIQLLEKIKKEEHLPITIVLLDADFLSTWKIKNEDLPKIY